MPWQRPTAASPSCSQVGGWHRLAPLPAPRKVTQEMPCTVTGLGRRRHSCLRSTDPLTHACRPFRGGCVALDV